MKLILTTIFATITLLCVGQVATLDIKNPAPRISDGVDVSVSFDNKKIKKIEGPMSSDEFTAEFENQLGYADINFGTQLLDTGLLKIGPFKFKINKTNFTTDVVTIRVYPDLPNVSDGIWLRLVTFKGDDILLIEQRVSHDWVIENGGHSSMSIDAEGVNFARLDGYKLYELGVESIELSSGISSGSIRDEILGTGVVSYKLTQYKLIKRDTFKNKIVITKDLFNEFPKDIDILELEIK